MNKRSPLFEIEMAVRDYECDIQGIVNNAIYQHYLEHARHQLLKWLGLDFYEMHCRGKDAVMTRAEIDYLSPLRSGDYFKIEVDLEQQGRLRTIFDQRIIKIPENQVILKAKITVAMLKEGKPIPPTEVVEALERKIAGI